jgi:hypothetical protein
MPKGILYFTKASGIKTFAYYYYTSAVFFKLVIYIIG